MMAQLHFSTSQLCQIINSHLFSIMCYGFFWYGFFWYAVDTNLFRLGSINPKKNSQTLYAIATKYKQVGINNLAELSCAKVQLGQELIKHN